MFRTSDTILIGVMMAAAAFTYKIKHDSESQMREARKLETQIRYQEDTISILKADWALMIQPARLQNIATHFNAQLGLQPTDPRQIVDLTDIPMKQMIAQDGDAKPGEDKIKTGSVKP